jgi:hypothetical protein
LHSPVLTTDICLGAIALAIVLNDFQFNYRVFFFRGCAHLSDPQLLTVSPLSATFARLLLSLCFGWFDYICCVLADLVSGQISQMCIPTQGDHRLWNK